MGTGVRNKGESHPAARWSRALQPSPKFFRLAHLRRLKKCEQVAAVCYRLRGNDVEFLLVQTRGGRWTFPKGSAERGLTHAQAAALEAFEEAGVHGRMEEVSFTRYTRRKGGGNSDNYSRSDDKELAVNAHLCEVTRLDPPQEFDRNPTWFSAAQAKRRLREGRKPDYGTELARVVDRAVARIQRLRNSAHTLPDELPINVSKKDALQKVHFIDSAWRPAMRSKLG
jgi:8-oxo-dGTP pyrophosphatase MutT (NUDIX family)